METQTQNFIFREWRLKDTSAANLFLHRLLVHGREFSVLCSTKGIDVRVRCIPNDMLPAEFPDINWIK